jgi:hypothetical protein
MNINTPLQLFTYTVDNSVAIKDLSSIANISKVIGIDENGGFQFYIDGLPDFLQGLTSLENNEGYAIISKPAASFPYELYASTDNIPESVTIAKLAQIATYCGTGFNLVGITITSQPSNAELSGDTASFSVEATVVGGVALNYQWQISTDDGANWNDINGETNATLNLSGLESNDIGNQYRVIVGATGEDSVTSNAVSLTAASAVTLSITQQPQNTTASGGEASFAVAATVNDGSALTYQWEEERLRNDGATWVQRTLPASAFWSSVTYGDGTFVAVADSNIAATSPDGITWTQRTLPVSASWQSVVYGNGTFVAVAWQSNIAATSTDGITWTQRTLPATASWNRVTYGNGTFVAVPNGSNIAATSPDGITWTQRTLPMIATWYSVTYGNGTFVAMPNGGNIAATSPDGITWTQRTLPVEAEWYGLAYGNGTFVAVAYNNSNIAVTSADGITWTQQTLPATVNWWEVTYGNGVFVAVTLNSNIAATSTDGVTWTQQTLPASAGWRDVTYGNGTFVVVASNTTVAATSDSTSLSLQFLPLDGETNQNLTLAGLTTADDGNRYRVVVDSPSVEPVTSDVATLTVSQNWTQVGADIDGEAAGEFFGSSVAISSDGSRVAIGGPTIDAGHVRVFDLVGSTWTQVGADIDGEAAGDQSGNSVALSSDGSRIAIGAYRNGGTGIDSGHVRVYDLIGSTWTQVGADIDGEAAEDYSGYSVALSSDGSRVAIGAYANDGTGASAGHVRVFDLVGSTWTQVGANIDGEAADDYSGWSVAMSSDGNRVVIGAHRNGGTGIDAGHVRVYDLIGSTWTQVGADIDGEAAGDYSGYSVAISSDGSRIAIGAHYNDGTGLSAGHVRVYDLVGSTWTQVGADIDGEAAGDQSGYSVALSSDGNRVAIGAIINSETAFHAGHVRVFDLVGSTWTQVGADIDGEAAEDYSGRIVAISSDGSRVAIGAQNNDVAGQNTGHVRVYEFQGSAVATEITITQTLEDITTYITSPPVALTVAASTNNGEPLSYQWFFTKYSGYNPGSDLLQVFFTSDEIFNFHHADYGFEATGIGTSQVFIDKIGTPNEFLAAQCRISAPGATEVTPLIKIDVVGGVREKIILQNAGISSVNGDYCFVGYSQVTNINNVTITRPVYQNATHTLCVVLASDQVSNDWAIVSGSVPTSDRSLAYYTQTGSFSVPSTTTSWEIGSLGEWPPPTTTKSTCPYGPANYNDIL